MELSTRRHPKFKTKGGSSVGQARGKGSETTRIPSRACERGDRNYFHIEEALSRVWGMSSYGRGDNIRKAGTKINQADPHRNRQITHLSGFINQEGGGLTQKGKQWGDTGERGGACRNVAKEKEEDNLRTTLATTQSFDLIERKG